MKYKIRERSVSDIPAVQNVAQLSILFNSKV